MPTERTVLTRLKMDVGDYVRGAAEAAAATKALTNSIDKSNERMAWLTQGILALAPAAVPIGAALVPAMAGLATQMGFGVLAAGDLVLAFHGLGKGLEAVNKYQLEPSAANLEKVREQFELLGPAGADFVVYLDQLQPKLQDLQQLARAGLFPGMEDGINAMLTRLPEVKSLITTISKTMGDLSSQAGHAIAGPEFDHFFNFLQSNAQPILSEMGKTIGNFVLGLSNMIAQFAPMSRSFSSGLLNMSQAFAEWSRGLDSNQAFQQFVDYVRESGPQVREFAGALIGLAAQLVEAAAPVGHVMLPALTKLIEVFANLADSPLGSIFIAAAAAMSLYGRAAALASVSTGKLASTVFPATANMVRQRGAILSLVPGMERYASVVGGVADKETTAAVARQGFFRSIRPGVAAIGLMTASMTDFDNKMGVSNTVMLGMAGAMAGPWGAALGAGAGALLDAAHANDDFYVSLKHTKDLLSSGSTDFASLNASLAASRKQFEDFKGSITDSNDLQNILKSFKPAAMKNTLEGIFGSSDLEEQRKQLQATSQAVALYQQQWSGLINALHGTSFSGATDFTKNLPQLSKYASSIQPALDALNLSVDDLGSNSTAYQRNIEAIQNWLRAQDSVAGRTKSVGAAVRSLSDNLLSTAQSADTLSGALDALISPGLDAEKATDALHQSLSDMKSTLDGNKKSFDGYTKSALENRDATRTVAENTVAMLSAMAKNGDSPRQLASALNEARQAFIHEGEAAGFSHKEIVARANAMGLTPKLVATVFKAAGIDVEARQVRQLKSDLHNLPKQVQVFLKQHGYDVSKKQIDELRHKYNLTRGQVLTIIQAKDHASALIEKVQKKADHLHRTTYKALLDADWQKAFTNIGKVDTKGKSVENHRYKTTVDAQNQPALSKLQQVEQKGQQLGRQTFKPNIDVNAGPGYAGIASFSSALNHIPDETVYINVKKRGAQADGGIVTGGYGANGRYYSRTSQIVPGGANILWAEPETGREAYISDKPTARDRNVGILSQVASWFDMELVRRKAADGVLLERQAIIAASRPAPVYTSTAVSTTGPSVKVEYNAPITVRDEKALARHEQQAWRDALALVGRR